MPSVPANSAASLPFFHRSFFSVHQIKPLSAPRTPRYARRCRRHAPGKRIRRPTRGKSRANRARRLFLKAQTPLAPPSGSPRPAADVRREKFAKCRKHRGQKYFRRLAAGRKSRRRVIARPNSRSSPRHLNSRFRW